MRLTGVTVAALAALLVSVPSAGAAKSKPAADAKPAPLSSDGWKVDAPHGPSTALSFSTDEGTWLALDVDPSGKQIVFSLLGDLYTLPIEGGAATRITSGPAYDVQPRFSPDGKSIAFASDRDGLENLWVCDRSGANCRQISKEKKRTVSSPAWSPDGQYLIGRKRLTDVSSLGTVELWLWHLKGGEGVALTKKSEQPDAADPVFSKDGRFVYFSSREARYRYDRDPNEGIWQLKRFDRRNGQSTPLTGEFGGCAAPAVSPDGSTLAFVRRVRATTVLELLDLASGRIRRVAEGLTRDNQEGFSFHGTFPGYAWMPDGHSIVATAEGKIWRYNVSDGSRTPIPFSAQVDQAVSEAVRSPQRLGTDPVRLRVIRWPAMSPDGKRLVFSAAGHLYGMDFPNGSPQRLTAALDFEYAPAFSADGKRIVFTTWNDREGGHVVVIPAAGGIAKRLTRVPGQYVNPAFSPDGTQVVYVASSGAAMRDHDLSDELWHEVRLVSAEGGAAQLVIATAVRGPNRRTPRPSFNAKGDRIYFVEDDPDAKPLSIPSAQLVSVKLDGTDKRKRLQFGPAEEAAVSPNEQWVVYRERHNVYVTALPEAGEGPIDVATAGGAFPVAKLTENGGEWVGWAEGADTISWSYGPNYYRLALAKAFPDPSPAPADVAKPSGKPASANAADKKADDKPGLPQPEVTEITLTLPREKPSGTVAYTNARLITMKGDEVIAAGTIVVESDRIKAVGASNAITLPAGATVVDLTGKTVIPGLFDEHAHLHYSTLDVFPQRPWKYLANLAYGVTSTHDPSASTQEVFGQAEMVEAGLVPGPRIFSTGYILYGADDANGAVIDSLDDARHHLQRLKTLGAFSVKSYMQPRRDVRQWIIQAARELNMMVVPEGGGDLEMDLTFVLDGHTTIEHALPTTPLYKDVVTLLGKSKTSYTPTLLVAYGGPSGEKWFYQHYDVWKNERLLSVTPQGVIDGKSRRRQMLPDEDWHHINVAAGAKRVVDSGGTVCLGGHGQLQGLGPHWEIWGFVQGGMSPLEALRVATLSPAKTLGLDNDLGSIEPGKLADFVVLGKNPLERIENTDSVELVVKNGVGYKPKDLERIGANANGPSLGSIPKASDDL
ncbi:MAG: amidohydrolase family protein [Acidobacteriota bacterium]